jgi:hypothetical protein
MMIDGTGAVRSLADEIGRLAKTSGMWVEWSESKTTWSLISQDGGITRRIDVALLQEAPRVDITPHAYRDDTESSVRHYFKGAARAYGVYIPIKPSQFRDLLARVVKLVLSLTESDLKETAPLDTVS